MDDFARIAEQRIEAAVAAGELDDLPGAGRPIELDDDALVPEELRMAYRVLRNAGMVPEEVSLRAAIGAALDEQRTAADDPERQRAGKRLALLLTRLEARGGTSAAVLDAYRERIVAQR